MKRSLLTTQLHCGRTESPVYSYTWINKQFASLILSSQMWRMTFIHSASCNIRGRDQLFVLLQQQKLQSAFVVLFMDACWGQSWLTTADRSLHRRAPVCLCLADFESSPNVSADKRRWRQNQTSYHGTAAWYTTQQEMKFDQKFSFFLYLPFSSLSLSLSTSHTATCSPSIRPSCIKPWWKNASSVMS